MGDYIVVAMRWLIAIAGLSIMIAYIGWGTLGVILFMWANNFDYVQKKIW